MYSQSKIYSTKLIAHLNWFRHCSLGERHVGLNKVSYRKQIARKQFNVVDRVKICLTSSLITMQNLAVVVVCART